MRLICALLITLSGLAANAGTIDMDENGINLAESQSIEKAFIKGSLVAVRSFIKPCPFYPKNVYGDVYECHTSREVISDKLGDKSILSLSDQALIDLLIKSNLQFRCNTKDHAKLMSYQGKNVYVFVGAVTEVKK